VHESLERAIGEARRHGAQDQPIRELENRLDQAKAQIDTEMQEVSHEIIQEALQHAVEHASNGLQRASEAEEEETRASGVEPAPQPEGQPGNALGPLHALASQGSRWEDEWTGAGAAKAAADGAAPSPSAAGWAPSPTQLAEHITRVTSAGIARRFVLAAQPDSTGSDRSGTHKATQGPTVLAGALGSASWPRPLGALSMLACVALVVAVSARAWRGRTGRHSPALLAELRGTRAGALLRRPAGAVGSKWVRAELSGGGATAQHGALDVPILTGQHDDA